MTIQAEGNYQEAQNILTTLGVIRPDVQRLLDRLTSVPVDIRPQFSTAELLLNGGS
jgi:hypothetical protein